MIYRCSINKCCPGNLCPKSTLSNKVSLGHTSRTKRSYRSNQLGATMVEASFSMIVLVFLTLCGIDILRVSFENSKLRHAVSVAARTASHGLYKQGDTTKGFNSARERIEDMVGSELLKFAMCRAEEAPCVNGEYIGDNTGWVYIRAERQLPLITYISRVTLRQEMVVKNRFPTGPTEIAGPRTIGLPAVFSAVEQ